MITWNKWEKRASIDKRHQSRTICYCLRIFQGHHRSQIKYVNYYIPMCQPHSTRSQPIQFVPTMQKSSLRHHYYTLSNTWLLIAVIIVVQDFSRIATMITGRSVCGVSQGSAYCLISRAHQYIYIFCRMALKLDLHIYGISLSAHSSVCHHMQACSFFLLF